jgi:TetR/AcrR family transcriptional repressor of mexJK operon
MQLSVSERKRADIARAALVLFARDGYERTSVDAIAAEAGVSKRTVYSHYGDKESLFLLVIADTYDQMRARFAEIIVRMTSEVTDVEKSLIATIREAVREVSHSRERALVLRLVIAELPHFPALLELWRNRGITPILTAVVTRLAAAGLLSADDPEQAAGHLSALTFGQINNRSMMGTIPLGDAEIDQIVTSGVWVFLRAYGA